jgi:hypothetical protein
MCRVAGWLIVLIIGAGIKWICYGLFVWYIPAGTEYNHEKRAEIWARDFRNTRSANHSYAAFGKDNLCIDLHIPQSKLASLLLLLIFVVVVVWKWLVRKASSCDWLFSSFFSGVLTGILTTGKNATLTLCVTCE